VLLFDCHVSPRHSLKIEYPNDESRLPDDFARTPFKTSSPLPKAFRRAASEIGLSVLDGARAFVFNADPVSVAQVFDIETSLA
jgi:hypothetical protein